jgi:hypothetical protein
MSTITELCPMCEYEVELQPHFVPQNCPMCHEKILPCNQCESRNCAECPLENIELDEIATCSICGISTHENNINMIDYDLDVCTKCEKEGKHKKV